MNAVLHKADTRGHFNHGWLNTYHTFSFAGYRHPERMRFGALRVLNDDTVMGGQGFDQHPHTNMEIVSIPLQGAIEHRDSMGNVSVIEAGSVQAMSAGVGVLHSEHNPRPDQNLALLQIWVLPNKKDVQPRYDMALIPTDGAVNKLCQIVSPHRDDQGVWIHQDAWFYIASCDPGIKISHTIKRESNGGYIFVIEGSLDVGRQRLERRDGLGVWDTDEISFSFTDHCRFLLMDIPMRSYTA